MPIPRRLGTRWWSLDADDGRIGPVVDPAAYPATVNPRRPPVPPPPAGVDWPRVINPD